MRGSKDWRCHCVFGRKMQRSSREEVEITYAQDFVSYCLDCIIRRIGIYSGRYLLATVPRSYAKDPKNAPAFSGYTS